MIFETKVKYTKIDNKGNSRNVVESYLLEAVTFTEAETRVFELMEQLIKGDFQILNIKKSNITEIMPNSAGELWYKAKISVVTIDDKFGKEKRINQYILILADDIQEAFERLETGLAYMVLPYVVTMVQESNIVDVFGFE